jgi:PAS domain S-box-containing protein
MFSVKKTIRTSTTLARKLEVLAQEKETARQKLVVTAKKLAATAKENESIRRKLVVTAKQLAANAENVAQANKYARSLIEASLDPLVTISPKGKITDVNEATIEVTGVSRHKLIGTDFSKYFTEPKKALAGYKKVFREGSVTDYPLTIRSQKGKLTSVLYNASVYKDDKGIVLGVFAAARDYTRAKKANELLAVTAKQLAVAANEKEDVRRKLVVTAQEKERIRRTLAVTTGKLKKSHLTLEKKVLRRTKDLEQIRSRNEAILTSIGDGLVVVDKEGKISYINKSFEDMLGWKSHEIIGKSMVEVVPREDQNGIEVSFKERILTQVLAGQKFVADSTNPFYYIRKDKSRFPASSIVAPVILKKKIVGAVGVFRDITKEKGIDKAKTEFVSLASHQLRTPLSTVNWYSEMLLAGDVGEVTTEQRKYLKEIYNGNQRMVDLVNTLLDVSRIELGTFDGESQPTNMVKLIESVVAEQKIQLTENGLTCSCVYDKTIPLIQADPKLLRMVIQNLLSNSIKYTPRDGQIDITLSLHDKKHVLLTVTDTGYGIPKNQQERIFTKLFRADNVIGKDTEGTGLGLYIAKSIVEQASGKLWFESEENKGTTFSALVPIGKQTKKELPMGAP